MMDKVKFLLLAVGIAIATMFLFRDDNSSYYFARVIIFSLGISLAVMFLFGGVGAGGDKKKMPEARATKRVKLKNAGDEEVRSNIIEMIYVRGGKFEMGATAEQADGLDNEKPVHLVTLSDYYIMKYEVTQKLWQEVMGHNPSHFKGENLPVENINWFEVQDFIHELNSITGRRYRLPTEAEWEYAARGGMETKSYKFAGSYSVSKVAWYGANSDKHTHPVGSKQANELGIYDMSGNVWEWVLDWYGNYNYSAEINPIGPTSGTYRVRRGGGWYDDARYCRVSRRYSSLPADHSNGTGFRLVLST